MSRLSIRNLTKSYGENEVIHSTNLEVESGEFVVLVGPSGCGKSTILRMIAGLEKETSGEIHIADENVTKTSAANRGIAMVFQSYALYPHMTVKKNLGFGLQNIKADKEYIEDQINRAANILQLTDYLDRLPKNLSGGQRQRVAIGRAIVRNPRIFLFDEPLSNLDADLRVQMRHEIGYLHRKLGSTMIYVTHDQVEAMTMADRIVVLDAGRIAQVGTPLTLYNEPDNVFVASFIGSPKINLLKGAVREVREDAILIVLESGHKITIEADNPALFAGKEVILGVRPEDISPYTQTGDCIFDIELDAVECPGDATYIYAKFGALDLRVKLQGQHSFAEDELLTVGVSPKSILLFDADGEAISSSVASERGG